MSENIIRICFGTGIDDQFRVGLLAAIVRPGIRVLEIAPESLWKGDRADVYFRPTPEIRTPEKDAEAAFRIQQAMSRVKEIRMVARPGDAYGVTVLRHHWIWRQSPAAGWCWGLLVPNGENYKGQWIEDWGEWTLPFTNHSNTWAPKFWVKVADLHKWSPTLLRRMRLAVGTPQDKEFWDWFADPGKTDNPERGIVAWRTNPLYHIVTPQGKKFATFRRQGKQRIARYLLDDWRNWDGFEIMKRLPHHTSKGREFRVQVQVDGCPLHLCDLDYLEWYLTDGRLNNGIGSKEEYWKLCSLPQKKRDHRGWLIRDEKGEPVMEPGPVQWHVGHRPHDAKGRLLVDRRGRPGEWRPGSFEHCLESYGDLRHAVKRFLETDHAAKIRERSRFDRYEESGSDPFMPTGYWQGNEFINVGISYRMQMVDLSQEYGKPITDLEKPITELPVKKWEANVKHWKYCFIDRDSPYVSKWGRFEDDDPWSGRVTFATNAGGGQLESNEDDDPADRKRGRVQYQRSHPSERIEEMGPWDGKPELAATGSGIWNQAEGLKLAAERLREVAEAAWEAANRADVLQAQVEAAMLHYRWYGGLADGWGSVKQNLRRRTQEWDPRTGRFSEKQVSKEFKEDLLKEAEDAIRAAVKVAMYGTEEDIMEDLGLKTEDAENTTGVPETSTPKPKKETDVMKAWAQEAKNRTTVGRAAAQGIRASMSREEAAEHGVEIEKLWLEGDQQLRQERVKVPKTREGRQELIRAFYRRDRKGRRKKKVKQLGGGLSR